MTPKVWFNSLNSLGAQCGIDTPEQYKYVYWPELNGISTDIATRACVSSCPVASETADCFNYTCDFSAYNTELCIFNTIFT